jgi:PAS domain S-box-containing protein
MTEEKTRTQFEYHVKNAQLAIQTRIRSYIDVLHGVAALFHTSDTVSREQFHAYVTGLTLDRSYPGISSLNFARQVLPYEKDAFIASVQRDTSLTPKGYPAFAIQPPGTRPEYHVLTYLEPSINSGRFGFDLTSLHQGTQILAVARDSGQLFSSGRLIRISGPNRHIGLAMRIPLYRRGMPTKTVEQRRAAYYGSVGAGFDVQKLMLGAVEKNVLSYMRIRLYDTGRNDGLKDSESLESENLLFDSAAIAGGDEKSPAPATPDHLVKRISMTIGPRVWEAEFSADRSAMVSGFDLYLPWLVLVSGIAGSTLLFSIYYSMMTARGRAVELAREMTRDLRNSEASLAEAQHMARLGSWTLEPISGKMSWSEETYRIFGMEKLTQEPVFDDFLRRIDAADRKQVREGLDHSITTGEEFTIEHRIAQIDGSMRWVQTIARLGHDEHNLLLRGTLMDITDRKQTVEALKRSQDLLRELTAHQDRVKEEERKRIAREIHDELGQTLLALRIDVSMLDARTANTHPKLNEKVRGALQHIDATVKTIRTIINNLRPAVLDLGLTAAIEWQVAEFRRRTGITCDLFLGAREFDVDDTRATSLFRILQESLTNVIRHAKATHVIIELFQENERLVMKITDNGVGIYPESRKSSHSFGLVGVEERIHALNGEFLITSAPGKGTTLTIYIPLENDGSELFPLNLVDTSE